MAKITYKKSKKVLVHRRSDLIKNITISVLFVLLVLSELVRLR